MIERYWWVANYYNELHAYTFGYCLNKNCGHSDEHEYIYDGQIFYKTFNLPVEGK